MSSTTPTTDISKNTDSAEASNASTGGGGGGKPPAGGGGGGGNPHEWSPEIRKFLVPLILGGIGFFVAYLMFFKTVGEQQIKNVSDKTIEHVNKSAEAAGKAIQAGEDAKKTADKAATDADNTVRAAVDAARQRADKAATDAEETVKNRLNELQTSLNDLESQLGDLKQKADRIDTLDEQLTRLSQPDRLEKAKQLNTLLDEMEKKGSLQNVLEAMKPATPSLAGAQFVKYPTATSANPVVPATRDPKLGFSDRRRLAVLTVSGVFRQKSGNKATAHIQFCDQDGHALGRTMWYQPARSSEWESFALTEVVRLDQGVTTVRLRALSNGVPSGAFEFHNLELRVLEFPYDVK